MEHPKKFEGGAHKRVVWENVAAEDWKIQETSIKKEQVGAAASPISEVHDNTMAFALTKLTLH